MQPTNIYYELQCNDFVKEEILSYYIRISLCQLSQIAIY